MASWEQRRKELDERKCREELAGGKDKIQKQHHMGKLTARERIDLLMDKGTFAEIDKFMTHQNTSPVRKRVHKGRN